VDPNFCEKIYWQAENEKGFFLTESMQATPVTYPISLNIKNAESTNTRPAIAKIKVFLAVITAFGSPPDVVSLIPAYIMRKNRHYECKHQCPINNVGNHGKYAIKALVFALFRNPGLAGVDVNGFPKVPMPASVK